MKRRGFFKTITATALSLAAWPTFASAERVISVDIQNYSTDMYNQLNNSGKPFPVIIYDSQNETGLSKDHLDTLSHFFLTNIEHSTIILRMDIADLERHPETQNWMAEAETLYIFNSGVMEARRTDKITMSDLNFLFNVSGMDENGEG